MVLCFLLCCCGALVLSSVLPDSCVASGVKRLGLPSTEESRVETVGFLHIRKFRLEKLRS